MLTAYDCRGHFRRFQNRLFKSITFRDRNQMVLSIYIYLNVLWIDQEAAAREMKQEEGNFQLHEVQTCLTTAIARKTSTGTSYYSYEID